MKKLAKSLFLIFIFLVLLVHINAATTPKGCITIKETSQYRPFGFDTNVEVCRWVQSDAKEKGKSGIKDIDAFVNKIAGEYEMLVDSPDFKGGAKVTIRSCDIPTKTKPTMKVKCSASASAKATQIYRQSNTTINGLRCVPKAYESNNYNSNNGVTRVAKKKVNETRYVYDCYGYSCPSGMEPSGYQQTEPECKVKYEYESNEFKYADVKTMVKKYAADKNQAEKTLKNKIDNKCKNKDCTETTCSYTSNILCPVYKCVKETRKIGACAPTFETGKGTTAYCVNPDYHPSENGQYKLDTSFDVNDCANSYSTRNCGYANILIEGAYAKKHEMPICDNAINLALRLWGEYTNDGGYNAKIGISNAIANDNRTSCSALTETAIVHTTHIYNVTRVYINKKFLAAAKQKEEINTSGNTFSAISCGNTLGLACAPSNDNKCSGKSTHRIATELFLNTLIGNKNMKDHLQDLFNGEKNTSPTGANVVDSGNGKTSYVVTEFEEISNMSEKGLVVDCKELRKNANNPKYEKEVKEILPFCKVKVSVVGEDGKEILKKEEMEKCIKGDGCYTKEFEYATCSKNTTKKTATKVIVYYTPATSGGSVKKYVACGTTEKHQNMFLFDNSIIKNNSNTVTETKEEFTIGYNCGSDCNNYGIRKNEPDDKNCTAKDVSAYVKDPSLSCIVNMASITEKNYYDYSSYYGLNQKICKIYCSDEASYKISGNVNSKSGLAFDYNIDYTTKDFKTDKHLSTIILQKRSCVSEIYYSVDFPEEDRKEILRQYGVSEMTAAELKSAGLNKVGDITNITKLLKAVHAKAKYENNRTENLEALIYDMYNCNLYKSISISRPKDRVIYINDNGTKTKVDNTYGVITGTHSKTNDYGIGKTQLVLEEGNVRYNTCSFTGTTNLCVNFDNLKYSGGAEIIGKVGNSDSDTHRVGREVDVKFGLELKGKEISGIEYCSGSNCLKYNKDDEYSISGFGKSSTRKNTYFGKEYTIPTNDYAKFEVITEVGFYNKDRFIIEPYTGYVALLSNVSAKADYKITNDYEYPLSKNAYTLDQCSGHKCGTTYNYGKISSFYRKEKNDRFTEEINKFRNIKGCFINVDPPQVVESPKSPDKPVQELCTDFDSCTTYRNVDMSNMFPAASSATNWFDPNGLKAKEAIEASATSGEIYKVSNDDNIYLEYSVTLNPEQMRNINSNYNDTAYTDNTLIKCSLTENGLYLGCESDVLREMSTSESYGTFEKSDGRSKHNE